MRDGFNATIDRRRLPQTTALVPLACAAVVASALSACRLDATAAMNAAGAEHQQPSVPARRELVPHQAPSAFGRLSGRLYFVAPAGRDDQPGTASLPFQTVQRAADIVSPGDTVIVEDGVYTRGAGATPCDSATARPVVCLTRGGSPGAPVMFRSRHKWASRIDGASNTSAVGFQFLENANYIQIDGFDVSGIGSATGSGTAFELFTGGHHVVISQNRIHDIGRLCTDTTNGQTGVFVEQPDVIITRNVFHDIGRYSPGEAGCAPRTLFYQNHDHGVYLDGRTAPGASGASVTNNVFYAHRHGWAIQLYPGTLAGVSIVNNTFASPNPYNAGQIIVAASTDGMRILNNLFIDPQLAGIYFYAGTHSNLTLANNLSTHALATAVPPNATVRENFERRDPRIADTDFRLRASSPAVGRGANVSGLTVDIDGVARPLDAPPDIGAHERPAAAGDPRR